MHTTADRSLPAPGLGVLHLTIGIARGGRRDAIVTLARASRRCGVSPHLATLRGNPTEAEPFRDAFDSYSDLGVAGRPSLRQLRGLRDHCVARGIRIVHAHDASSQFVASMLRVVAPTLHIIMTFHRSLGFESAGWRNRLRNAASLVLVDRVLTASLERRQHFLSENFIPDRKVATIPLGIDLDRFRPDPAARATIGAEFGFGEQDRVIVSAGHFGPEKGLDIAIAATAVARRELAGSSITLRHLHLGSGDRARQAWLTELISATGSGTILVGQRSDPERFFAAADLMLHTPRMEAFGLVLIQAMATGLPVVASNVGGIPEIVVPTVGELSPVDDSEATGRQVAGLMADPDTRAEFSLAALKRAQAEYSATTYAERHRAVYDAILR